MRQRANYALLNFGEHLGIDERRLDVPWAEFVGDESSELTFEVAAEPDASYLEVQAYDVGSFDHEIHLNGEPLSGFDVPPAKGWQYWMDAIVGTELRVGENSLQFVRDVDSGDSFVVGNVVVNWKEPVES